jgi:hypothetical protein
MIAHSSPVTPGTRPGSLAGQSSSATFVTGVIGLAFNDFFESLFHSPVWTGVFLLCTSVILTTAEKLSRRTVAPAQMSIKQAVFIGLAQAWLSRQESHDPEPPSLRHSARGSTASRLRVSHSCFQHRSSCS